VKINRAFWQEVIDHLSEGVLICDAEGRLQWWNRRARQLLERQYGALPAQFNFVQEVFTTVEGRDGISTIQELLQWVVDRNEEREGRICLDPIQKEKPALHLKVIPLAGRQMHRDILILLGEASLSPDATKDAVEPEPLSPAQVIAWTAGVAHEIRNPLSAIGNCIEILDKQLNLEGDNKELVTIALSECERLDRVLSNLLTLARRREPHRQLVEVHELVERTCVALQYDTRFQPTIELKRDFGAPAQLALWIDRDQISQVLWNLLINAVHAMPNGGELRVSTGVKEEVWFRLSVRDTGIGMSHEVIQKALQPFFTTKISGTGLGLATAKEIVSRHGGRLVIESEEGKGTEVTVLLPLSANV
jgi:signal transduction histidine kinase